MNYFNSCKSIDEAKQIYKYQAKKLHPDTGGSTEDFQELKKQYEVFCKSLDPTEDNLYFGFDVDYSDLTSIKVKTPFANAEIKTENILNKIHPQAGNIFNALNNILKNGK